MNDQLRRNAVVRKATYFGIILALFTVSMFWRGVFKLPVGDPDQITVRDEKGQFKPLSVGDRIARLPINYQAEDLELRDRDAGDPEVAGALAQVSLVGVRGAVVTVLWNATTTAQKRGEYHDMEKWARLLTKVQPHFIAPWVFQAWNISYNVSVETDKLGDQYYYIARGIQLLAEGDRVNTRTHRRGREVYLVGSPDLRHQLGFYAQNKFSVSDKVSTLYSLSQLSLIPPDEREAARLRTPDGRVDLEKFRVFCENNPRLVRRLKTQLNMKKPEQVLDFLEANWRIPARFDVETKQPQAEDKTFPVFPRADAESEPDLARYLLEIKEREERANATGRDSLDVRQMARSWFEHAQAVVPPPIEGVASLAPKKDQYDRFRYRIPERPSMVIFRTTPPRSQTYVAERLQQEGWFDDASVWNPDAGSDRDATWFPARPREAAPQVVLKAGTNSRDEYEKAHQLWKDFGRRNGLRDEDYQRQRDLALETVQALGAVGTRTRTDYTDDELAALGVTREQFNARTAILVFDQNRDLTQYQWFLDSSLAEMSADLARARRMFADADALHARNDDAELGVRLKALALWRKVFTDEKHAAFYQSGRSEQLSEFTLTQHQAVTGLLEKAADPEVAKRAAALRGGLNLLTPSLVPLSDKHVTDTAVREEAMIRIVLAEVENNPNHPVAVQAAEEIKAFREKNPNSPAQPGLIETARGLLDGPFAWRKYRCEAPDKEVYWVMPQVLVAQWVRDGIATPPEAGGPPGGITPGQGPVPRNPEVSPSVIPNVPANTQQGPPTPVTPKNPGVVGGEQK